MPKRLRLTPALPEEGYVRLQHILGDPDADPPIPAIIPVSKSAWYEGMKNGKYPRPRKFGPRTALWDVEAIRALLEP